MPSVRNLNTKPSVDRTRTFRDTGLHIACHDGNVDAVRALLQSPKLPNVQALNSNNETPLDAARNLDAHTTRMLLEALSVQAEPQSIVRLMLCKTGGVGGKDSDFKKFEDNLTFMFGKFPKLQHLIIDACDGLCSLPPSVSMLTRLQVRMCVCVCVCLCVAVCACF